MISCLTKCGMSIWNGFINCWSAIVSKLSCSADLKYGDSFLFGQKFMLIYRLLWLVGWSLRFEWWRWTLSNIVGPWGRKSILFLMMLDNFSLGICICAGIAIAIPSIRNNAKLYDQCA